MVHELKSWPQYFAAVVSGVKRFEIRKTDRPFAVGDTLVLRDWNPDTGSYTGRSCAVRVTYLTHMFLPPGLVVLGIELSRPEMERATEWQCQCPHCQMRREMGGAG